MCTSTFLWLCTGRTGLWMRTNLRLLTHVAERIPRKALSIREPSFFDARVLDADRASVSVLTGLTTRRNQQKSEGLIVFRRTNAAGSQPVPNLKAQIATAPRIHAGTLQIEKWTMSRQLGHHANF